jgi:hypothetical protein
VNLSSAQLTKLIDAGLSADQLRVVAEIIGEKKQRSPNAERQARYRDRHRNVTGDVTCNATNNVTDNATRDVTVGSSSPSSSLSPTPPILTTTPPSPADGDDARDDLGWPVDRRQWAEGLIRETGCLDPHQEYPRNVEAIRLYLKWHDTGLPWQTIVDVIREVMAKKRDGPPSTMGYFSRAIVTAHVRQNQPLPEPVNERRSPDFKPISERREDSTIAAFRNVFGRPADSPDEPGHAA